MSNNYIQRIVNPLDPGAEKIDAVIPYRLILHYYKYYPVRFENLVAAKHVLENPRRIFAGVRQFSEGGWCFTGRPKAWKIGEHESAPFPDNLVFAVYLNSRFVVYECRAERADSGDDDCPENWENRYATLIWKSTF